MRVLVCGGRDFNDWVKACGVFDSEDEHLGIDVVIHGAARGADSLADRWARERGKPTLPFPADWHLNGRAAGPIRNQRMLDEGKPNIVIAFPGGRGTADMVRRARAAGIPVEEIK